jgi:hypothetical protein
MHREFHIAAYALLKAAIDGVKDALTAAEGEHTDAATLELGDRIANALSKKPLQLIRGVR